jgi:hypothetical protein
MTDARLEEHNQAHTEELYIEFAARLGKMLRLINHVWPEERPRISDSWRSPEQQEKARKGGFSKLAFGYHNVTSGGGGEPAAMAADIVPDNYPMNPSAVYKFRLAGAARVFGLKTGLLFGLRGDLWQATNRAIEDVTLDLQLIVANGSNSGFRLPLDHVPNSSIADRLKLGWDSCHVEVAAPGFTVQMAKAGKRPVW